MSPRKRKRDPDWLNSEIPPSLPVGGPGGWAVRCQRCGYTSPKRFLLSVATDWFDTMHMLECPGLRVCFPRAHYPYRLHTKSVAECESCQLVKKVDLVVYPDATFIICASCSPCEQTA